MGNLFTYFVVLKCTDVNKEGHHEAETVGLQTEKNEEH